MKNGKKLLLGSFWTGFAWMVGKIHSDREKLKICKKNEKIIRKHEAALAAYEQWVEAYQKNQHIGMYLLENHYRRIAVYGLGRLGKQLCRELAASGVDVVYVIDRDYAKKRNFYKQMPCFHPENTLPKADLILTAVPGEDREIAAYLRKKVTCPVKSINDMLFVL